MFALLNQHYERIAHGKSVRIAIGRTGNPLCKVADNFRVVTVLYSDELPNTDSAFLNRFEIRNFTMSTLLDAQGPINKRIFSNLVSNLNQFFKAKNVEEICEILPPFYWMQNRGLTKKNIIGKDNPTLVSSIVNFVKEQNLEITAFERLMMLVNPNYRFRLRQKFGKNHDQLFPGSVSVINLQEGLQKIQTDVETLIHIFLLDKPIGTAAVELYKPEGIEIYDCSQLVGKCTTGRFMEKLKKKIEKHARKDLLFVFNLFEYKKSPVLINQLVFLINDTMTIFIQQHEQPRFVILMSPPEEKESLKEFWTNIRLTFVPNVRWTQLLTIPFDNPILKLCIMGDEWIEEIYKQDTLKAIVEYFQIGALFYAGYNCMQLSQHQSLMNRVAQYPSSEQFCQGMLNFLLQEKDQIDAAISLSRKNLLEIRLSSIVNNELAKIENIFLKQFIKYFSLLYNVRTDIGQIGSYSSNTLILKLQNHDILVSLATFRPPLSHQTDIFTEFPLFLYYLEKLNDSLTISIAEIKKYRHIGSINKIVEFILKSSFAKIDIGLMEGHELLYFNYCYIKDVHNVSLTSLRDENGPTSLMFLELFSELLMFCIGFSIKKECGALAILLHVLENNVQNEFLFRPFFDLFGSISNFILASKLYQVPRIVRILLSDIPNAKREDCLKVIFINLFQYAFDNQLLIDPQMRKNLQRMIISWERYHEKCSVLFEEELIFCKLSILCYSSGAFRLRGYAGLVRQVSRANDPRALWELHLLDKNNAFFIEKLMIAVTSFIQRRLRSEIRPNFTFFEIFRYILTHLSSNLRNNRLKLMYTRQTRLILTKVFAHMNLQNIISSNKLSLYDQVAVEDLCKFLATNEYKNEIILVVLDAFEACKMKIRSGDLSLRNARPLVKGFFGEMYNENATAAAYYKRHVFELLWIRLLCRAAAYGNDSPRKNLTAKALKTIASLIYKTNIAVKSNTPEYHFFVVFCRFVLGNKSAQGSIDKLQKWFQELHDVSARNLKTLKIHSPSDEIMEQIPYNPFSIKGKGPKELIRRLTNNHTWEFDGSFANALHLANRYTMVIPRTASHLDVLEYKDNTARLMQTYKNSPFLHLFTTIATYNEINPGEQILEVSSDNTDIIAINMLLLATAAEAAAKVQHNKFLNYIWPFVDHAPSIDTIYLPCGADSEEARFLSEYGEEKITGIVLCKDCMTMIVLIDNGCGLPYAKPDIKRTCKCEGKVIILGDHVVSPSSVIAVQRSRSEQYNRELQAYKDYHKPKKGFEPFPNKSVEILRTNYMRDFTPKEYWIVIALTYTCLCVSFPHHLKISRQELRKLLLKALNVLCSLYDKPLSEVIIFVHAVRSPVFELFAHSDAPKTDEERRKFEARIKDALAPSIRKFDEVVSAYKIENQFEKSFASNHLLKEAEYTMKTVPFHKTLLRRTPLYSLRGLLGENGLLDITLKELSSEQKQSFEWLIYLNKQWNTISALPQFFTYMEACRCTRSLLSVTHIDMEELRTMSIASFCEEIHKQKNIQAHELLNEFQKHIPGAINFWNTLPDTLNLQVRRDECGDDLPRGVLSFESSIRFFFPSSINEGEDHALPGRFARAAIKKMVETQNQIIQKFFLVYGKDWESVPPIEVSSAPQDSFSTFPSERDVISCVFCEFVPFRSSNTLFDLISLQKILEESLVRGCARFDEESIPDNKQIGETPLYELLFNFEEKFLDRSDDLPEIPRDLLKNKLLLYDTTVRLCKRIYMLPWKDFDEELHMGEYPPLMNTIPLRQRNFFAAVKFKDILALFNMVETICAEDVIQNSCPDLFRAPLDAEVCAAIDHCSRLPEPTRACAHDDAYAVYEMLSSSLLRFFIPRHETAISAHNEFRSWDDQKGNLTGYLSTDTPISNAYFDYFGQKTEETEMPLIDLLMEQNLRIYHAYSLREKIAKTFGLDLHS
eukprot:gnl/Chilomastix_cuspidata/8497.p1 GENE.gnl/Chilomastix_cuspidata/8497~~gnl/Chilomastix_cuspidata/8497.p1  ORF type:complete len:1998 (+),score=91.63 gnl/Chilomastix_cuspidata/8497:217-5994(+)